MTRRQTEQAGEAKTVRSYTVVLLREEVGGFSVSVPALPGCHTEGETVPECLDMAREAIGLYLAALQRHGDPVPGDVGQFPMDLGDALDAMVFRVTVPVGEAVAVA